MAEHETFALENPITAITGKKREDLTRDDIIKVVIEEQIERITFHYTGLDGKIKELKIPIEGREHAELILTEGERVDGSSLFKGMVDPGKSDLYVVPVYKSAFLNPFDEGSLDFICRFLNPLGELAAFPPDNILINASNMLKKNTGMELHALGELEFFLIGDPETNNFPMPKQKGYHASAPYSKSGAVLNDILNCVMTVCGNIKYAHSEVGYLDAIESELPELMGMAAQQVELEFLPTPIEETGDILVLARWIIRNVASEHGYTVTFVPKLEVGHAGNGMHVHMLLKKDGKNALVDAKGLLTDTAKKLIGGLCKYASSMNAFGNSVAASYLRLVPHQEAPTKVCWSAMNRSALIRVPLGWNGLDNIAMAVNPQQKDKLDFDSRQTVEIRSPDGSCNSHFLLAGITMAAEWGLNNPEESLALAAKSHVEGDIHGKNSTANDLDELATSCCESADRLLQQREIFERNGIFPKRAIDTIVRMLKEEDDKDMNARLMKLPDAEKLEESRRIMHRDIHKN